MLQPLRLITHVLSPPAASRPVLICPQTYGRFLFCFVFWTAPFQRSRAKLICGVAAVVGSAGRSRCGPACPLGSGVGDREGEKRLKGWGVGGEREREGGGGERENSELYYIRI